MNRCLHIGCIALLASAAACSTGPADDLDVGTDEASAKGPKPPKPPEDAGTPDSRPPAEDGPPPADGPPSEDAPPPVDAPPPPPAPSTPGFIDACLLPGMTKATFTATSTFDAHDEGVTAALNLPFSFTFYGTAHTKYWITTNGQLGFGNTVGGSMFGQTTCPLPASQFTTPIVLVYSTDLIGRLEPHAGVCYGTTGTAPNRKLVVTWKDSFFYDAWLTSNVTFSAILNEGTNVFTVVIERVDAPNNPDFETGWGSTLGRQSGTSASTHTCYQMNAPEGTVIHYNP